MTAQPAIKTTEYLVADSTARDALEAGALYEVKGPLGVILRYGRLMSFPEDIREQVLMMPVLRYVELGYVDTSKVHEVENFNTYDQHTRQDVHVHVTDPYGTSLYNVNFVQGIVPLPTEALFDLKYANGGQANTYIAYNRRLIAEPSRLVGADYKRYKGQFENGLDPEVIYKVGKSMLAMGIAMATKSMGIKTWLFNYDPKHAGNFVKSLTGVELEPLSGVTVRPEAYEGPFGPYFEAHRSPDKELFVTLSNAVHLAALMGAKAREDLARYSK